MEIEYDVAKPEAHRTGTGRRSKYPFAEMGIGGSFFVPGRNKKYFGSYLSRARRTTSYVFQAHDVTENGVDGVRVWRDA